MIRLGITGGIGSGKSTVCNIFSRLGAPVYHADERARWLVENDAAIRQGITDVFGARAFENGVYNRPYIASLVFQDKQLLAQLNAIVHPAVLSDWDVFCAGITGSPYVIKEAAIMLEAGGKDTVDRIVLVHAPLEVRISRLMKRDGLSREAILDRINSQMPEEEKMKLADDIIYNDEQHSLIEQVRKLHKELSSAAHQ